MAFKYSIDDIKYKKCKEFSYIVIHGWCLSENGGSVDYKVLINHLEHSFSLSRYSRKDVLQYLKKSGEEDKIGFKIYVDVKDVDVENIQLFSCSKNDETKIYSANKEKLNKIKDIYPLEYYVDSVDKNQNEYKIYGWAYSLSDQSLKLIGRDVKNNSILESSVQWLFRNDVGSFYDLPEAKRCCGFQFDIKTDRKFKLYAQCGGEEFEIEYDKKNPSLKQLFGAYAKNLNSKNVKKAIKYVRDNGVIKFAHRLTLGPTEEISYNQWFSSNQPTKEELEEQKKTTFSFSPKISLICATYNTPIEFLNEMISSVLSQTYSNWELCIADGSTDDKVQNCIEKNYLSDSRIKFQKLSDNFGISENMNAALSLVSGDYVGLYDHDDMLTPNALFEVVSSLQDYPYQFIYTDEDKYMTDLKELQDPHFKSDFNIDLLRSVNYICHFLVVSKKLIEKVGGFRKEFDGAQDYDFVLRCIENISEEEIHHIPQILYHWRMHSASTASNPQSKLYAFEAGKNAIQAHLNRVNLRGTVSMQENLGLYRVKYEVLKEDKVSILIPNKDHIEDLQKCISSILKSSYTNYEIIVIENNSVEERTFSYYDALSKEYQNIKVVYWDDEFNYSAINNFGAKYADGKYLLLLNNDTEMLNDQCIEEMVSYCQRKDVGIVGARLVYDDNTIQHAGVIVGLGGIAGHSFIGKPMNDPGYFGRILCAQDLSAVTAACLMVKKEIFNQVNGLSEDLKVAFNDIDFCLKVRRKGYLVVYNPYAILYHYESKSRGAEDSPEKIQRFNSEIQNFRGKWPEILSKGDPYYNPNLTYMGESYTLKQD